MKDNTCQVELTYNDAMCVIPKVSSFQVGRMRPKRIHLTSGAAT